MKRRPFITASTALLTTVLAGCSSGDNGDIAEEETPTPDDVEFEVNEDAPARPIALSGVILDSDLIYQDQFSAEIMLGNAGGQPIEEGTEISFSLTHDNSEQENVEETAVVLSELQSGETTTVTVGPFTAPGTGEWNITPGSMVDFIHDEYNVIASISPLEYSEGDTLELPSGVRVTVSDVSYEQALFYEISERRTIFSSENVPRVVSTLDDQIITLLTLTIQNGGSNTVSFGSDITPDQYRLSPHDAYTRFPNGNLRTGLLEHEHLSEITIEPGESKNAWIAGPIEIEKLSNLQFEFSITPEQATTPEFIFDLGDTDPAIPQFEFVELDLPNRRIPEEENELGIIIENTGSQAGTFRGVLRYDDGDEWLTMSEPYDVEIPVGGTERAVVVSESENVWKYRVDPFGVEFEF